MVVLRARSGTAANARNGSNSTSPPKKTKDTKTKGPQLSLKNQTLDSFRLNVNDLQAVSSGTQASKSSSRNPSQSSTPHTTPRKSRGTPKKKTAASEPQSSANTIHSFFDNAARLQQNRREALVEEARFSALGTDEDFIEDDYFEEEMQQISNDTAQGSSTALAFRKRSRDEWRGTETQGRDEHGGSFKFRKGDNGKRESTNSFDGSSLSNTESWPWVDRYGPTSIDELAVHKKKVKDVRTWLEEALSGQSRKRLLVLKGPAGSAKTTTVNLLAKELGVEIREWKNTGGDKTGEKGRSGAAQFDEFLRMSGQFGSLNLETREAESEFIEHPSDQQRPRITLVEEFPNTFTPSSSALLSFRSVLRRLLAGESTPIPSLMNGNGPKSSFSPVVMSISETLLTTSTAAADSFTAFRLLGPQILSHPRATVIEFNQIAPTILLKALTLVIQKEARVSGRRRTPGPQVLNHLSQIGDVRSSVSCLEFLCVRGDEDDETWSGKVAFSKTKRPSKDTQLTKREAESLQLVTQRESTLGIFHSVGKVVYNKRQLASPTDEAIVQPPPHLPQFHRPKVSEVDVNRLIDELGTDTQTFIAALHENYVLSCEGTTEEDTADIMSDCIDALSLADLLSPNSFSSGKRGNRGRSYGGTFDLLRQDELSFQYSVRSMLFSLPHPVKRVAPPPQLTDLGLNRGGGGLGSPSKIRSTGRGDAFKMFFPTSLKLWQPQEEMEGLLEIMTARAQRGELQADIPYTQTSAVSKSLAESSDGVESWRRIASPPSDFGPGSSFRAFRPRGTSKADHKKPSAPLPASQSTAVKSRSALSEEYRPPSTPQPDTELPRPTVSFISRTEMLLDRLPYLTLIHQWQSSTNSSTSKSQQTPFSTAAAATTAASEATPTTHEWDKLTRFRGLARQLSVNEEEEEQFSDDGAGAAGGDGGAAAAAEQWSTDAPGDAPLSPASRLKRGRRLLKARETASAQNILDAYQAERATDENASKGLVLSDDDIESP